MNSGHPHCSRLEPPTGCVEEQRSRFKTGCDDYLNAAASNQTLLKTGCEGGLRTGWDGVIVVVTAMLSEKYHLTRDVERGIRFLKNELSCMYAVLLKLEDKTDDQIDPTAKDWRNKVRELSYDIEDCIDCFMLNHNQGGSKANFVGKAMRKVKTLWKVHRIAEEIQELKSLVKEQIEQGRRYYDIRQCLADSHQPVLLDVRAPALFQEERDLVGIDGPRKEVIRLLKVEEKQHKVVSIYGTAGQGKTTLTMEVYHKIPQAFDCRAFVSVSQTPDIEKLLRDILSQISKSDSNESQSWETGRLIHTIREHLMDKRYFTLIDDIWSVPAWELVRSSLPFSDNGSRVISTTRSKVVAKSCCAGIAEQMYEAKPLNNEDSQRLFFKRLFFSSEECPQDLREVSNEILRKCGGLPLAIISIAGLLANRSQTAEVWANTLKSIAAAVDKDSPIDKMKRILLLSYVDLPPHLKSCLLYLSVFPEDYLIDCRQLILLWVAEALVPGQDRASMEQLGRSYLNELINRSLVQPAKVALDSATVKQCRVHDVILEFVVSKAVEDNFVTIWNRNGFSNNYNSYKIRRLSIQEDISARAEEMIKTINLSHIRSINIFGSNSVLGKHAYEVLTSQVLRVLNIDGYVEECCFACVKSFGQMKYLRINGAKICKLPENTEKLQHIQTLDVRGTNIRKLPASIIQLQKLVRLYVQEYVQLPDGIGNLQALEEVGKINLGTQSVKCIHGLGDVTNLRVLEISWDYSTDILDVEGHKKTCMSSLSKLFMGLRELRAWYISNHDATLSFMASCARTPPLRTLILVGCVNRFSMVSHQISSLVNLTRLYIQLGGEVRKEGIDILATLARLVSLTVYTSSHDEKGDSCTFHRRPAIIIQGFQQLVKFHFDCLIETALEFDPGAMPKLQRLTLWLLARCQFKYGTGGLVLGLQNLPGLKHVALNVYCGAATADEVQSLEDDVKTAAGAHPNSPILQLDRYFEHKMAEGCSRRPSDHVEIA